MADRDKDIDFLVEKSRKKPKAKNIPEELVLWICERKKTVLLDSNVAEMRCPHLHGFFEEDLYATQGKFPHFT